jgi:transcriptional regulator with XRE-family HTH domain
MLDIYSIFHEMDTSSLVKYFFEIANKKTILRLLCEEKNISISKLSNQVEISANTLAKYNASDDALYNGSFMNIMKLVKYFDVPPSLFEKELIYFIL